MFAGKNSGTVPDAPLVAGQCVTPMGSRPGTLRPLLSSDCLDKIETPYWPPRLFDGNRDVSIEMANRLKGLLDGRKYLGDNDIDLMIGLLMYNLL